MTKYPREIYHPFNQETDFELKFYKKDKTLIRKMKRMSQRQFILQNKTIRNKLVKFKL